MATETNRDVAIINDEDVLRKMWQETEDFGKKKEIRAHMYKLREERLKNFYDSEEVKNSQSTIHSSYNITEKKKNFSESDTRSHADALTDHSFMSLKSKEVRDSSSPIKELHFTSSPGNVNVGDWTTTKTKEVSNDGRSQKEIQSGSMSTINQRDNAIERSAAEFENVNYFSKTGDENNFSKQQGSSSKSFSQQNQFEKGDNSFQSSSTKASSSSSSSSQVISSSSSQLKTNPDIKTDDFQRTSTQVTAESYTRPDGTKVTTETFYQPDGTRVTKTKYEKAEARTTSSQKSERLATTETSQKIKAETIHGASHDKNKTFIQQSTNDQRTVSSFNKQALKNLGESSQNVVDRSVDNTVSITSKSNEVNISADRNVKIQSSVVGKADSQVQKETVSSTVNKSERKTSAGHEDKRIDSLIESKTTATNVQSTNLQDSRIVDDNYNKQKYITTAVKLISDTANLKNVDTTGTVSSDIRVSVDQSKKQIERERNVATTVSPQKELPKSSPSKEKLTDTSTIKSSNRTPQQTETKTTKGQYDTTYKNDYCSNNRISVEASPTHQYFASTLRSVSPDRNKKRSSSLKSSTSSLRSSSSPDKSSPERKFYLSSRETSPTKNYHVEHKTNKIVNKNHQSSEHLKSTNYQNTSRDTRKSKTVNKHLVTKPRSRSVSPATTTTSDFEFVRTSTLVTDLDDDICITSAQKAVKSDKKTKKVDERSYSSPVTTKTTFSPTHPHKKSSIGLEEKPKLRRKDTYEERCKEILGLSGTKTETNITSDHKIQSLLRDTKEVKVTSKSKERLNDKLESAKFITKQKEDAEENTKNLRHLSHERSTSKSPEKETVLDASRSKSFPVPSQKRRTPERPSNEGLRPVCDRKSPSNDATSDMKVRSPIQEFPSQMRRSPVKEPFETLPAKSSLKSPTRNSCQIQEFPSQIRRTPEKNLPDIPKPHVKEPFRDAKAKPGIQEFPSQIRRSPEKELYERPSSKSPSSERAVIITQKVISETHEAPSQTRRAPETNVTEKPYSGQGKISPTREMKVGGKSQIEEYPSQIRRSPEKEPLQKPHSKSPIRETGIDNSRKEHSKITEFPSQTRRIPEKCPAPTSLSDLDKQSPSKQTEIEETQVTLQILETPDKIRSPEKKVTSKMPVKSSLASTVQRDDSIKTKTSKFLTNLRDTETTSQVTASAKNKSLYEIKSPKKPKEEVSDSSDEENENVENMSIDSINELVTSSTNKTAVDIFSKDQKKEKHDIDLQHEKLVKLNDLKTSVSTVTSLNQEIKPKKLIATEDEFDINDEQERASYVTETNNKFSQKHKTEQSLNLSADKKKDSDHNVKEKIHVEISKPKEVTEGKTKTISLDAITKSKIKNNKTTTINGMQQKKDVKRLTLTDEVVPLKDVTMHITESTHKVVKKDKPKQPLPVKQTLIKSPDTKTKVTEKSVKTHVQPAYKSNKEDEIMKVSANLVDYKNKTPVNEPKAVKKFISLLYDEENADRSNIKRTSKDRKIINDFETKIIEREPIKRKRGPEKKIPVDQKFGKEDDRNKLTKDTLKKQPITSPSSKPSDTTKKINVVKLTIAPPTKIKPNVNQTVRQKNERNRVEFQINKKPTQDSPPKKIEKVLKVVTIAPYSTDTKSSPKQTIDEIIRKSPQKKPNDKVCAKLFVQPSVTTTKTRHIVTAILPVPPPGKKKDSKTKGYTETIKIRQENVPSEYKEEIKITESHKVKQNETGKPSAPSYKYETKQEEVNEREKIISNKSVTINADLEDEKEVIIKLQRSKSSREATPDYATVYPCDDDGGIPRYPDQINEPDDLRCRSGLLNLSQFIIDESAEATHDERIEEIIDNVTDKRNINRYEETDECLLSVNEKVDKFVSEAKKLVSPTVKPDIFSTSASHKDTTKTESQKLAKSDSLRKFIEIETAVAEELNSIQKERKGVDKKTTQKNHTPVSLAKISSPSKEESKPLHKNEPFTTPKSSRKTSGPEESKVVLSPTSRSRNNESIRKAKQIFENFGEKGEKSEKSSASKTNKHPISDKVLEIKPTRLFHEATDSTTDTYVKSRREEFFSDLQGDIHSERKSGKVPDFMKPIHCTRHSSPSPERMPSASPPSLQKDYTRSRSPSPGKKLVVTEIETHVADSRRVKQKSPSPIKHSQEETTSTVSSSGQSSRIQSKSQVQAIKKSFEVPKVSKKSEQELHSQKKNLKSADKTDTKTYTTSFKTAVRRFSGDKENASTIALKNSIEEIFDLELLENLLEQTTEYDLRSRIRAQIRIVKKLISENKISAHTTTITKSTQKSSSDQRHESRETSSSERTTKTVKSFSSPERKNADNIISSTTTSTLTKTELKTTKPKTESFEKSSFVTQKNQKNAASSEKTVFDCGRTSPKKDMERLTNGSITNYGKDSSSTYKVQGTVVKKHFYSENGEEPVGEISITKYSSDPNDFKGQKGVSSGGDVVSVTTTKKIGDKKQRKIESIENETNDFEEREETIKTAKSSKFTRKGSVKEMSKKFIENAIQTCKNEKQTSYPKAGLILRSSSFKDSKNSSKDLSPDENVHIRTVTVESKITEGSDGSSSNTFLSNKSKVTGVQDVITRMKNAENENELESKEDREARLLLNKFLGCQVLLTGMESSLTSSESRITTIKRTTNEGGKPTTVQINFRHPITEKDLLEICDPDILKLLLEKCSDYEEQQIVRARLNQVMAEQEARGDVLKKPREPISNASIHGESLLPLLQGLLNVPETEQTADSGTESGEDLRGGLVNEVQCALAKLSASLKTDSSGMTPEKRTTLLQLVTKLQAGLSSQNNQHQPSNERRASSGSARFVRRRQRQNRHTVGVSSEELEDARRLMEEIALREGISAEIVPTEFQAPITKQNSEGSVQNDYQPVKLSSNKVPVKNAVAKPYSSSNTSLSHSGASINQSGASSTAQTPSERADSPDFNNKSGSLSTQSRSSSHDNILNDSATRSDGSQRSIKTKKSPLKKDMSEKDDDSDVDSRDEVHSDSASEASDDEENVKSKKIEYSEPDIVKSPPKLPLTSEQFYETKANVVLKTNPIYSQNHDPEKRSFNRFNSKKSKMKRANTIDIPKPLVFYDDEDSDDEDEKSPRGGNTLGLRGPIQVGEKASSSKPLPTFEAKTDNDRKFMAFINKFNNTGIKSVTSSWSNRPPETPTRNHWGSKFGNLKKSFEMQSTTPTAQNLPKNYWKSVDDTLSAGKVSYNGPTISRQSARNLQKMFEEKTKLSKEPQLTTHNYATPPQNQIEPSVGFRPIPKPAPINKFSHAPTSAFMPIPKKNTPPIYQSSNATHVQPQKPNSLDIPKNIVKIDLKSEDPTSPGTQLYLYSPKTPTNKETTRIFSPISNSSLTSPISSTPPWSKTNELGEHRVHKLAASKFEKQGPINDFAAKPRSDKVNIPQTFQRRVISHSEPTTAPYLSQASEPRNAVRKLSDQFDHLNSTNTNTSNYNVSVKPTPAKPEPKFSSTSKPHHYQPVFHDFNKPLNDQHPLQTFTQKGQGKVSSLQQNFLHKNQPSYVPYSHVRQNSDGGSNKIRPNYSSQSSSETTHHQPESPQYVVYQAVSLNKQPSRAPQEVKKVQSKDSKSKETTKHSLPQNQNFDKPYPQYESHSVVKATVNKPVYKNQPPVERSANKPGYVSQISNESVKEYQAAETKVMKGPVSHQAVTVHGGPKTRNEHDLDAAFNLKLSLNKYKQNDTANVIKPDSKIFEPTPVVSKDIKKVEAKTSKKVLGSINHSTPEAINQAAQGRKVKIPLKDNSSHQFTSRSPLVASENKIADSRYQQYKQNTPNGAVKYNSISTTDKSSKSLAVPQRSSSLKHSSVTRTETNVQKVIPNFFVNDSPVRIDSLEGGDKASTVSKMEMWQKIVQENQSQGKPVVKSILKSKSSNTLAVPNLQFQAGMTKDELVEKKRTIEAYFAGSKSPQSLSRSSSDDGLDKREISASSGAKSVINRKKTSDKVSSQSQVTGVIRSRTLPNIVCPGLLDESNIDEAFEDLFRSVS